MISKSYIEQNLRFCDARFRRAKSTKENLFYSKLALMELCGWIEISMDDVILRCAKRRIRKPENTRTVEKDVIKRNYGFDYDGNFRRMLMGLIGLAGIEKLEKRLDQAAHARFVSTLGSLKLSRDAEAHTYVKGATKNIDAPSLTLSRLTEIYLGLSLLDKKLQSLGF